MIEEILGGLVSVAARILSVCKQSRKPAQHQIYQSDGFCPINNKEHRPKRTMLFIIYLANLLFEEELTNSIQIMTPVAPSVATVADEHSVRHTELGQHLVHNLSARIHGKPVQLWQQSI